MRTIDPKGSIPSSLGDQWRGLSQDLTSCLENRNRQLADCCEAIDALIQTVEQLIPEPSARGVADVVLFQGRAAIANAFEGRAKAATAAISKNRGGAR